MSILKRITANALNVGMHICDEKGRVSCTVVDRYFKDGKVHVSLRIPEGPTGTGYYEPDDYVHVLDEGAVTTFAKAATFLARQFERGVITPDEYYAAMREAMDVCTQSEVNAV